MHHHKILLPLLLLLSFTAFAQTTQIISRQELEDRELGWMAPYPPERARAPMKVNDRVYSPAQLSLADNFARWMQASYMPKAVSVTKTGESIRVQLDGQAIAEYEKAVPAGLLFNAMSFLVGGNHGEHDKFYISNIAIRKP